MACLHKKKTASPIVAPSSNMSNSTGTEITKKLLTSLAVTYVAYGCYLVMRFFYRHWTSPLRHLPGPPSTSFLWGNADETKWAAPHTAGDFEKWVEDYGSTITYTGMLGIRRFYTTDLKALNHIIMNNYIYQRLPVLKRNIGRFLGEGLAIVEEDVHKKQRRVMNPAFATRHIRDLTPIFVEKSRELCDALVSEVANQSTGIAEVDLLDWSSRTTLDIIGLAGFNYKFNAFTEGEHKNELFNALGQLLRTNVYGRFIPILRGLFPSLSWLPAENDALSKNARVTMNRIGRELLQSSKDTIAKGGDATKDSFKGNDLLTLLLRANAAVDIPDNQRMSDEEVLSQVPTFLIAGHETTATSFAWAMFSLSNNQRVQKKLREEILGVSNDDLTMEKLSSLWYLDAVVREALRLHSPFATASRISAKDDLIPLGKPVTDKYGKVHDYIPIRKGDSLFLPILHLNRDKSIWGEDAHEFKPERWESIPEEATQIPGIWGNQFSFLGGPRGCIGYRFAIVEMKALIFTVVRQFEFELAVPAEDIGRTPKVIQRPYLLSKPNDGNQLPMKVKLFQSA